ncbi:hypothetical protein V1524DRAFT_436724 [Lipomyces starkeyi]
MRKVGTTLLVFVFDFAHSPSYIYAYLQFCSNFLCKQTIIHYAGNLLLVCSGPAFFMCID